MVHIFNRIRYFNIDKDKKLFYSIASVSYTHLDVYKRQILLLPHSWINFLYIEKRGRIPKRVLSRFCELKIFVINICKTGEYQNIVWLMDEEIDNELWSRVHKGIFPCCCLLYTSRRYIKLISLLHAVSISLLE